MYGDSEWLHSSLHTAVSFQTELQGVTSCVLLNDSIACLVQVAKEKQNHCRRTAFLCHATWYACVASSTFLTSSANVFWNPGHQLLSLSLSIFGVASWQPFVFQGAWSNQGHDMAWHVIWHPIHVPIPELPNNYWFTGSEQHRIVSSKWARQAFWRSLHLQDPLPGFTSRITTNTPSGVFVDFRRQ